MAGGAQHLDEDGAALLRRGDLTREGDAGAVQARTARDTELESEAVH